MMGDRSPSFASSFGHRTTRALAARVKAAKEAKATKATKAAEAAKAARRVNQPPRHSQTLSPESLRTTVKDRMVYASSKDALKKKFPGIMRLGGRRAKGECFEMS